MYIEGDKNQEQSVYMCVYMFAHCRYHAAGESALIFSQVKPVILKSVDPKDLMMCPDMVAC